MPVDIDESGSPLFALRYHGQISDEDVQGAVDQIQRWVDAGAPFGVVVLPDAGSALTIRQRKLLADAMGSIGKASPLRACAAVVASPLVRGTLSALMWMAPPKFEFKVCATREEAEAWVRGFLR